ncbi:MAG: hypothetical protein Q9172_002559 [Xanthocarpia lactea]
MASDGKFVIAFDLYGTLLSTKSIAEELAKHFGDKAVTIAATWRKYQLEYTWRLNSMAQYMPFSSVTQRSLHHALSENDISLPSEAAVASLMSAYDSLSIFPDVAPALESLVKSSSVTPVVFSNGTQQMVGNSVHRSPDLSPYSNVFSDMVTVEEVRKFKPHPDVYYHLANKVGKSKGQMGDIWLVSGNPFDIVGAKAVGMKACWVDREGQGWSDRLAEGNVGVPDFVGKDLGEIVEVILKTPKMGE